MKTIQTIHNEVYKLYNTLEVGNFFNTYHDLFLSLLLEFDFLENDEIDLEIASKILNQAKAIIKAQKTLNNVQIK